MGCAWRIMLFVCGAIVFSGAANAQTISAPLVFSDNFSSGNLNTPTYSPTGAAWNNPYGWAIQGSDVDQLVYSPNQQPLIGQFRGHHARNTG